MRLLVSLLALLTFAHQAPAALQFDVFPGYESKIVQAAWFPFTFEVFNDGPPFDAVIEVTTGFGSGAQKQLLPIELPTNTRKRAVMPVFATGGGSSHWNCRLLDRRGNVIAERLNLLPQLQLGSDTALVGGLPRVHAGLPSLPSFGNTNLDLSLRPAVARLLVEQFPDHPIALDSLTSIYLSSEKAIELRPPQIAALLTWLHGGGNLIVGVEQPGEVNSAAWLRDLLPCSLGSVGTLTPSDTFNQWLPNANSTGPVEMETPAVAPTVPTPVTSPPIVLSVTNRFTNSAGTVRTNVVQKRRPTTQPYRPQRTYTPQPLPRLKPDDAFDTATLPIVLATPREGATVTLEADGRPLVIEARRGRGKITVLAFSAEREPFLSWANRSWFWLKAASVSPDLYQRDRQIYGSGETADGLFGALVDSKQVNKLPFGWLVLLLVGYLVVIGPLDHVVLKRWNKQMLTWITFPCYVAGFSFLVYFIGYALRAGENEWNEVHVVDVLPRGENATLRGRSYASVYSASNRKYPITGDPAALGATLRGELISYGGQSQVSDQTRVVQKGNNYAAELYVPVWTTFLCASDWAKNAPLPVRFTISAGGNAPTVEVENLLDRPLKEVRVVHNDRVHLLGEIPAKGKKQLVLSTDQPLMLSGFVSQQASEFIRAARMRRQTFGGFAGEDRPNLNTALAMETACFPSVLRDTQGMQNQTLNSPPGLDLSPAVKRGDFVLLAFVENHSFAAPLNQFSPRRGWKHTLLRLVEPMPKDGGE